MRNSCVRSRDTVLRIRFASRYTGRHRVEDACYEQDWGVPREAGRLRRVRVLLGASSPSADISTDRPFRIGGVCEFIWPDACVSLANSFHRKGNGNSGRT